MLSLAKNIFFSFRHFLSLDFNLFRLNFHCRFDSSGTWVSRLCTIFVAWSIHSAQEQIVMHLPISRIPVSRLGFFQGVGHDSRDVSLLDQRGEIFLPVVPELDFQPVHEVAKHVIVLDEVVYLSGT